MKHLLLIFYIILIDFFFITCEEIKEIDYLDWTGNYIQSENEVKFSFYLRIIKQKEVIAGASLYLGTIELKDVKIYLDDSEEENPPNDNADISSKAKIYIPHKIQDNGYYIIMFNKTESLNYKLFFVLINNKEGKYNDKNIQIRAATTSNIQTFSTEYSTLIKIQPNVPVLYKVTATHMEDKGLTYIFFISSDSKHMKIFTESKFFDGEDIVLNKAEVISLPKESDKKSRIVYYLLLFGDKSEEIKLSYITTEYQTLYFINKSQRTSERTYDIKVDNAFQPFLALGEYEFATDDLIYFEQVFGNLTIYYSNSLLGKNLKNFLPNEKSGIKLSNNYLRVYSDVDIISVICDSMCMFNLHIISLKDIEKEWLNLGETEYVLLNKFILSEKYLEISGDILENTYYDIISVGNKQASVSFLDEERNVISNILNFDFHNGRYRNILPRNTKYLLIKTTIGEDVLVTIKTFQKSAYFKVENEGTMKINNKNILVGFKKSKDYYKIKIDIKTNGNNFKYQVNYGDLDYVSKSDTILPTANRTNEEHHFQILNPYLNSIGSVSANEYFYYSFTFNSIANMEENSLIVSYSKKNEEIVLNQKQNYYFNDYYKGAIEQKDSLDKQLLIVMSKCHKYEVNLYLSYNGLDLFRGYMESNIYNFVLNDLQYSFDMRIEKDKEKEEFSPVNFFYAFVKEDTYSMYQVKDEFSIEYSYGMENKTFTNVTWFNPIAKKAGEKVNFSYEFYEIENEIKAISCNKKSGKLLTTFYSINSTNKKSIAIDRTKDSYLLIVLRQEGGDISPEIYYTPIKLIKFIEEWNENETIKKEQKKSRTFLYIIIGLAIIIVIIVIAWIVYFSLIKKDKDYKRAVNEVNSMDNNKVYGTSLVETKNVQMDEKEYIN